MDGLMFLLDQAGRSILSLQEENARLRAQIEAMAAQVADDEARQRDREVT